MQIVNSLLGWPPSARPNGYIFFQFSIVKPSRLNTITADSEFSTYFLFNLNPYASPGLIYGRSKQFITIYFSACSILTTMRLSDRDAGPAINARLEPLGRTALSIIYAEKSEPQVVIKATGFWLDGEMYDHAALAEDTSETFKREGAIYDTLGSHEHILKSYGVAYLPAAQSEEPGPTAESEREAWALKLERAPHGNLRERILKGDKLPMAQRLDMALDLAETLQYIHSRGVMWGDIST